MHLIQSHPHPGAHITIAIENHLRLELIIGGEGSIAANIGEGYSRSSGRDRARFFEYALGSAKESGIWYRAAVRVLDHPTVASRMAVLEEIQRMLQAVIPRERDRTIRPGRRRHAAEQGA